MKRDAYVGCHITQDTKEALEEAAARLQVSVSQLVAEAIEEKLARLDAPATESL